MFDFFLSGGSLSTMMYPFSYKVDHGHNKVVPHKWSLQAGSTMNSLKWCVCVLIVVMIIVVYEHTIVSKDRYHPKRELAAKIFLSGKYVYLDWIIP